MSRLRPSWGGSIVGAAVSSEQSSDPGKSIQLLRADREAAAHRRMRTATLSAVARHRGTESSNPFPSSRQSVSAVNPGAASEKPRTLVPVCGWLGT
jgi:hypothetical protein